MDDKVAVDAKEYEEEKRTRKMETIRNLLRRAENTSFESEAAEAIKKAQELMIAFAVDEEELWANDPSRRTQIEQQSFPIASGSDGAMQKRSMLAFIAKQNSCRCWYEPQKGGKTWVAGFATDLVFVDMLYTSIITQANFKMAMALAKAMEKGEHHRVFKADFWDAYQQEIKVRLDEYYRKAQEEADATYQGSTALVLINRQKRVDKWIDERMQLKSSRMTVRETRSYGAKAAGQHAAKTTDISGGRRDIGSPRKELNR